MVLTGAAWTFVFLGSASLLWPRRAALSLGLLGTGYLLALTAGVVEAAFVIPVALLVLAAYAVAPGRRRPWRIAGHILFIALASFSPARRLRSRGNMATFSRFGSAADW